MAYNPATDFVGLWRGVTGGVEKVEMPGLDFVIAALGRAGIINLTFGGTPPTTNQSTTAWLVPASPSYTAEGVFQLWNATAGAYAPATPRLFFDMLAAAEKAGNNSTAISSLLDTLSATQGSMLYRGSLGWQALGAGGVGQVLTGAGAGANPSWAAAVNSFNTRTGAVTLTLADVTGVGGAPLASPAFTGTATAPSFRATASGLWSYGNAGNNATGAVYFNQAGSGYLYYDGSTFNFVGGQVNIPTLNVTGNATVNGTLGVGSFQTNSGYCQINNNGLQNIAGNAQFGIYSAGSFYQTSYSGGWAWQWNPANGDLVWTHSGSSMWIMRASDTLAYNSLAATGGNGAYVNLSDRDVKDNIEDWDRGLDTVLALRPRSFTRRDRSEPIGDDVKPAPSKLQPRPEIGFIAQEIQQIIPEAVLTIGLPIRDKPGEYDGTLGMQDTAIIAVLVNAVKELSTRVVQLDGLVAYLVAEVQVLKK